MFSAFNFFCVAINTLRPALEMYFKSAKSKVNESNFPSSLLISSSNSCEVIVSMRPSTDNINSFSL